MINRNMEGKSKIKDLEEDEELKALRLAALATLKSHKKPSNDESKVSDFSSPINSIVSVPSTASESESSQIPFVQTDRNSYTIHSWRKQNQPSRKRGGPFIKNSFQKASHRSNLIVISPVSLDDNKEPNEKPVSSIVLPQHKWCNSGNEDSMSPKTIRRTGPTRFNRHGSDSESSDSDYEDESDNDSGSNETVLQDEPPEHFTRVSPESKSDAAPELLDKKRRLSFQNIDSEIQPDTYEKKETNSVYNCLKNSNSSFNYSDIRSDNYASVQNESGGRSTWGHSVENNYTTYNQYNSNQSYSTEPLNSSANFGNRRNSTHAINGESHIDGTSTFVPPVPQTSSWQHPDLELVNSYYTRETTSAPDNSRPMLDRSSNDFSEKRNAHIDAPNTQYFSGDTSYASGNSKNVDNDTSFSNEKRYTLSQNDLRLELKKRLQEYTKKGVDQNETVENRKQNNNWSSSRQRYAQQEDKIGEECSSYSYRSRQDESFNRERLQNEHSSRKRDRSLSQEKRKERSLSREKSRHDLESDHARNRHDDSKRYRHENYSNRHRDRHERSSSRDRSRRERSSTRERSSHDRSSSEDRSRYECNSNRNRRRHERSSSRDRNKHERSLGEDKNKSERNASPDRTKLGLASFQDKIKHEHSPERSQKEMSHTYEKSQRDRSTSQDRTLHGHSLNRDKNRHERSSSQNRSKLDSSSLLKQSDSFASQNKRKSEAFSSQSKLKNDDNLSQDRSIKSCHSSQEKYTEHEYNSTELRTEKEHPISLQKVKNEYSRIHKDRQETESRHEKFRERNRERNRQRSKSRERYRKGRSRSPIQKRPKASSNKQYYARSRSRSSSSSSSSYSSSSSHSSGPKIRSVPSVVKSISSLSPDAEKREHFNDMKSSAKTSYLQTVQSDPISPPSKRGLDSADLDKSASTKSIRNDIDQKNASDSNKRVPVHMRLGAFPRKRVIQMTKDVEAAFVNSSSSDSESVNNKCKKKNIRIVTDIYGDKDGTDNEKKHSGKEKSDTKSPDSHTAKSRRLKSYR